MVAVLVALTAVLALAVIAAFVFANDPFRGTTRTPEPRDTDSDRFYATSDRPAGPDAEDPPAP